MDNNPHFLDQEFQGYNNLELAMCPTYSKVWLYRSFCMFSFRSCTKDFLNLFFLIIHLLKLIFNQILPINHYMLLDTHSFKVGVQPLSKLEKRTEKAKRRRILCTKK